MHLAAVAGGHAVCSPSSHRLVSTAVSAQSKLSCIVPLALTPSANAIKDVRSSTVSQRLEPFGHSSYADVSSTYEQEEQFQVVLNVRTLDLCSSRECFEVPVVTDDTAMGTAHVARCSTCSMLFAHHGLAPTNR